uniref:NUDE domain-containing protein n=1 Tax=Anopheles culicifacies TaxID=139723 RepID=A0A182LXT7_9DIPT
MEDKLFTSVEEECLYWKERCLKVSQERDDAQREFDDFTTESRQLEAELEMTVEQQEKKIRDLNQLVNQLHGENESYKRKMQYTENETNKIDADYRQLAKENEKLKVYIRELEQKNDDLERANRVASESVAEFESMLNQAYEKNALLELEVDEKERMQIKLQRLMDEARDLKQELKTALLSPSSQLIIERNGNNASSTALVPGGLGGINAPMAPSDRVSTLNIVADLLRRLDNMEAKLKAWKIRKPSSRTGPGSAGTMASNRTSLHTSHTISNLHHSSGTGALMNSNHQNHQNHHHSNNHHYQSQLQQQHHHTDSNLSLNSLGSADGTLLLGSPVNCSSSTTGGNVQLHSYQPSTITIGTQTSQHLPASSLAAKTELLRTNK